MYTANDILKAFRPVVGWREDEGIKSPDMSISESGRFYQDFHPMLTGTNLMSIAGASSNGNIFERWLREKTDAAILSAISMFCSSKLAGRNAKRILENRSLFNGAGSQGTLDLATSTDFVGFEFNVNRSKGVRLIIPQVGLHFIDTGALLLCAYHSSMSEPIIDPIVLDYGFPPRQTLWHNLPNWSFLNSNGGSYYIGYYQYSTMKAVNYDRDWSRGPCISCNRYESDTYRAYSQFLEIRPFRVRNVDRSNHILWDIRKNEYSDTANHGLNFRMQVSCDFTVPLIEQKHSFQDLIGTQVALDLLKLMAYNPNADINRNQANMQYDKNHILYEIDGDSRGVKHSGLSFQRDQIIKGLSIDFSRLGGACFPSTKPGMRYRVI